MAALLQRTMRLAVEYLVLYTGLVLLGVMSLGFTAVAGTCWLLIPRRRRRAVGRWAPMMLFRIYLAALRSSGKVHTDLTALDVLRDAGPLVIAPNHPGLLDALLVISRLPDVALILKGNLMNNPFLGVGARMAGYIRNDSARTMIRQSVEALGEGSQLLLFPEGTRTVVQPLNPLKASFAVIAKRAGVPIQIVIIETNTRFLGKGWPLWKRPDMPLTYKVRLGPRIEPSDDAEETLARVREAFERELGAGSAVRPAATSDTLAAVIDA